jgi:hypothetical protein
MSPAALKNTAYYAIKKPSSDFGKVDTARMEALYFNEPYTTGYSTCWSEGKLVDLHVHKSWETLDFYRELEEEKAERWPAVESKSALYWVYRPLNPGEYVEQVWLSARYEADDKSASSEDSRQSLDSKPCTRTAIAVRCVNSGMVLNPKLTVSR